MKQHWLGKDYLLEGVAGNDINHTNVPDIRVTFRYETLLNELSTILQGVQGEPVKQWPSSVCFWILHMNTSAKFFLAVELSHQFTWLREAGDNIL